MPDRPLCELVLPRDLWEATLPDLLLHPHRIAVGTCRRNRHAGADELLVQTLETTDHFPTGDTRPPLSDWVVLGSPTRQPGQEAQDAGAWLDRLKPRKTQLLAVALLGLGAEREAWEGRVVENGEVRPLEAIRVVGPGMLRAGRHVATAATELSEEDLLRWSRTRGALGDAVWRKLAASQVLLFGAGRNGSAMAFQLAALGVRSLTIVDRDRLGLENLDAGFCVTEEDVGRPKADALQQRLHACRSDCRITSIPHSATHGSVVAKARGADLIVTCVDNDTPRLAAALLARRFLKVHLDVGTGVTFDEHSQRVLAGDVRLLLPRMGCVCCVGGLRDEDHARYELRAPPGALPRRPPPEWHQQRAGSLITLNSLTVASGVQLWLDLLAGRLRASHWQRLRWEPGQGLQADFAPVGASPGCRLCHGDGSTP
jgi:hypothetical protein